MSLLRVDQIHKVLREEAAARPRARDLGQLLEKHQLTPDDVLENLRSNMVAGENGSIRQKAVDTALKLNGLLGGDETKQDLQIIINLIDPTYTDTNPILIPRE
jgi:hypothetical protein